MSQTLVVGLGSDHASPSKRFGRDSLVPEKIVQGMAFDVVHVDADVSDRDAVPPPRHAGRDSWHRWRRLIGRWEVFAELHELAN